MVKAIGDYAAAGAAATPNARLHARPPLKGPLVAEPFAAIIGGPPGCAWPCLWSCADFVDT